LPYIIEQVYSPTKEHAAALGHQINAPFVCSEDEISTNADIYLLAVKDDVVHKLARTLKRPNALIVHTAGSIDLQDIASISTHTASIWPMYSIHKNELPTHRQIPLVVQSAQKEDLEIIQSLANMLSDTIYLLDDEQKKWAHLSAVFANNFTNHIVGISQELLKQHQIPENLILPILQNTVDKLKSQSAFQIQTGPAVRHDNQTIASHRHMLRKYPSWKEIYESLTVSIQAQQKKIKLL
ncbi:MAG TPA: DUF2520 domain-containing protein, partial [Chitinophagaceae bacterium]|nr:DUF2520 domain-containing protein [Chitinophagaceae bacterium]